MRSISACLLLALVAAPISLGQEKKTFTPARLLPGRGVCDPAGKLGFFPNTTGGIDALDLTSGKLLWSSKDANRPLLATESRLYAQKPDPKKANQLRIVILDSMQNGKRLLESQPIVFPDWVSVPVTYGRTYRDGARLDVNGLWLAWEARGFYAGGAAPTPEIQQAARKEASGVMRIDLDTGKPEPLAPGRIAKEGFSIANEVGSVKLGGMTLTTKDGRAKNAKNPFQRRRVLHAAGAGGATLWEREIAAPVFLIPRP